MRNLLFAVAALSAAAAAIAPAMAQQPCWEGPAPSCIAPYGYSQGYWPPYYPPGAAPNPYPYWAYYADGAGAPFANESHAYIMNPR